MSYNEQLQRIVKKYEDAGNPLPATAHDIAIWAIEQGLWVCRIVRQPFEPRPVRMNPVEVCRSRPLRSKNDSIALWRPRGIVVK